MPPMQIQPPSSSRMAKRPVAFSIASAILTLFLSPPDFFARAQENCRSRTETQYVTCGGITCSTSSSGGCNSDERQTSSVQRDCNIGSSTSICYYDVTCCERSSPTASSSSTSSTSSTPRPTSQPVGPPGYYWYSSLYDGVESFEEACEVFEEDYKLENEEYNPTCYCDRRDTYGEAVCYDSRKKCIEGGLCAYSWKGDHFDLENENFQGFWLSFEHESLDSLDSDRAVVLSLYTTDGSGSGDTCWLHVDGENCDSCQFQTCEGDTVLGFVADCSNHNFFGEIDSCKGTSPTREFEFFFHDVQFETQDVKDDRRKAICDAEFSRAVGERQRTVSEIFEPAHTCRCIGPLTSDDGDEIYRIDCDQEDDCEICNFGKCVQDSSFSRIFSWTEKDDGTIETDRIQQNHCMTFVGGDEDVTACRYSGQQRVGMTLNGDECLMYDRECNEGNQYDGRSRPNFDCTSLGDQLYDFCLDNEEGLVPDPSGSYFAWLHEDYVGNQCTSSQSSDLEASSDCNTYTQLPHGQITYGMNDGGCFFCAETPGSSIPLKGEALAETCEHLCNTDPDCIAFEVSRPAAIPALKDIYETEINCCLERTVWPSEVFVDASDYDAAAPNMCLMDSLCWTRFEKNQGSTCWEPVSSQSDLCSVVLDSTSNVSDEDIQAQAEFIENGCDMQVSNAMELLDQARSECEAEIESELQSGKAEDPGVDTGSDQSQNSDCNAYTQLPHGQATYGLNNGGCFFCSETPGSTIPLEGNALANTCEQMCNADPDCIAFEVSRPAVTPALKHVTDGLNYNCCLERTVWPSEVFVDASDYNSAAPDMCKKGTLCWTRYEKDEASDCVETSSPTSNLCMAVYYEPNISDEEVQNVVQFVEDGCDNNDATLEQLLNEAYDMCKAEIEAGPVSENVPVTASNTATPSILQQLSIFVLFLNCFVHSFFS